MVELFRQLDTVGKLRYKEKLAIGMLGVTTDPCLAGPLRTVEIMTAQLHN